MVPLVKEYGAGIVVLCISDKGMPRTVDDRLQVVDQLVERLIQDGIPLEDIYVDP